MNGSEWVDLAILLIPLLLLALGYAVGKTVEVLHFKDLDRREMEYKNFLVTNLKRVPPGTAAESAFLCQGQVVIGSDHFKTFAAGLRNIIGGRVRSFERMVMRARREAVLRMQEDAIRQGGDLIINVRMVTSNIVRSLDQKKGMAAAEVLAYGTAIKLRKS